MLPKMNDTIRGTEHRRREHAILTAAYLYSLGQKVNEIATLMKVKQPTVSRYLTEAWAREWLKRTINEPEIPAHLLEAVKEETFQADKLREKVKRWAGREIPVCVCYSGSEDLDSEDGYRLRLARFGKAIAPSYLREVFPDMEQTGVAWGRTLRGLVEALLNDHAGEAARAKRGLMFFPVVGEPLNHPKADASASRLVADLHGWADLGGTVHSMDSVAACIPLHARNVRAIRSFFCHVRTYAAVFGEQGTRKRQQAPALIDQMNCLLTSVGTKHLSDDWIVDAAEAANMSVEELNEVSYGNISGVFLPKPTITPASKRTLEQINERGTGIKLHHLQACAVKRPGVGVLAIGKGKGLITRECLRRHLVSRLYLDHDLKDELLRLD